LYDARALFDTAVRKLKEDPHFFIRD